MATKVSVAPSWDCKRDGHMIALSPTVELGNDYMSLNPFCRVCHGIFMPSPVITDTFVTPFILREMEKARWAEEAPPEAYEGLFS